ncbi:MAG: Lcl domain-containing protein, partial [Syntrophorhabdaceae bacterium]
MAWPSPRFTDNLDQMITDNLTGLIWSKDANAPGPVGCIPTGTKDWQGALDYVKCLNLNNYLGYNDWHLPNAIELESLVNVEQANPATWLISQGYYNVKAGGYWSSTSIFTYNNSSHSSDWGKAFVVDMTDGYIGTYVECSKSTSCYYTWPVRTGLSGTVKLPKTGQTTCYDVTGNVISCATTGQDGNFQKGETWPSPRFTDNGDQTVTDNLTGLMWTKDGNIPGPTACSPGVTKTWQGALDYVKCINTNNYLGYNDWRLPNRKEQHSLGNMEQASSSTWLNSQKFVNVAKSNAYYWSSDTYAKSTAIAWHSTIGGKIDSYSKTLSHSVWPVRSGQSALCTYTLSSTGIAYGPQTGTGSFIVTPSADTCTRIATSNASWITVTSVASGTGTGTVAYSLAANTGAARAGTITAGGRTFTITQAGWTYSNSVGSTNSIKVTDMSGTLPSTDGTISVMAWDANGNSILESGSAAPLKLYNNGTTTISGPSLAARFIAGTPTLYGIAADSARVVITNVKTSSDGTLNIPTGYASDTTNYVTNSVGPRNSIKITDMSGTIPSSGAAITVKAWDTDGVALTESGTAAPLKVLSHGTTTIPGPDLMARFGYPSTSPMSYEFTVDSAKLVLTNVKSSADLSINIPYGYSVGMSNFVANSIGPRNTIKITDLSGTLSPAGAAITITAWDENGNSIVESSSALPLKLYSHGTTSIPGADLMARFPTTPMAYEFSVGSTKYIITNVKASADATLNIPYVYTSGTTKYATNFVSSRTSIRISDLSGAIPGGTATITVSAWDVNGN